MSTTVPKRRLFPLEVLDPEDLNAQLDAAYQVTTELNEHNLDASEVRGQLARVDNYSNDIAYRIHHFYETYANDIMQGIYNTAGMITFKDRDQWVQIHEHSWTSTERASIMAMATVQVGHTVDRAGSGGFGLSPYNQRDAMNVKLAWELDGQIPSEHVCGSMDNAAAGPNMERGIGGEFNAGDLSATFPNVPAGHHTLKLSVLRAHLPDTLTDITRQVRATSFEGVVWEMRR